MRNDSIEISHEGMKKAERFLITRNNTVGVLGVKHRPERHEF